MEPDRDGVNRHIGGRLRLLRSKHRLTLKYIGELLGVSHQQVENYESGKHRLTADALFILSRRLKVDPRFFFEGLLEPSSERGFADGAVSEYGSEPASSPESSRLDGAFAQIRSRQLRMLTVQLVETVAAVDAGAANQRISGSPARKRREASEPPKP